ncbi:hypothetical protein AB0M35_25995 [Micromonospora sp. NPDC051196]|uniref:hypothetical protein n=1 Tax=Micromonospora sp. NPDC051196 TaxID=3155281 RepID=UPI00343602DA
MPFAGTSVVANMLAVKQIQVMSPYWLAPPMSWRRSLGIESGRMADVARRK